MWENNLLKGKPVSIFWQNKTTSTKDLQILKLNIEGKDSQLLTSPMVIIKTFIKA
jgi:hypothetical protein